MTCLDILSLALEDKNIRWAGLNGKMILAERSRTIDAFRDETDLNAPDVLFQGLIQRSGRKSHMLRLRLVVLTRKVEDGKRRFSTPQ